jgi:LEA14-like dessication related protein
MRRLTLGVASAALVLTAGCSALGRQAFEQPVVQLKDVAVQGLGLTGGTLAVRLNVYNPNGYRLDATRLSYNVRVGDNVDLAAGTLDSQFTVQSGDSTTVVIPVNFTFSGIGAAGRQLLNTGGVAYRVNGDVTVATVVGNFTVPYTSTGRFTALGGNNRQ